VNLAASFDANAQRNPHSSALTLVPVHSSASAPTVSTPHADSTAISRQLASADGHYLYQELATYSSQCVGVLQRLLRGHDLSAASVAWAGGNAPGLVAVYLACARLGVALVLLEPAWPKALRKAAVDRVQPTLVLDEARLHAEVQIDAPVHDVFRGTGKSRFLIGFTSGSSGVPKAFVRSQESWLSTFRSATAEFALAPGRVVLAPGPLSHGLSFYAMAETLHAGGHFVGLLRFDAATVLQLLHQESVHTLVVVPTMLAALLTLVTEKNAQSVSALALARIVTAGAKLTPQLRARVQQCFPATLISEYYGASELSFVTVAHAHENPPPESVGRAFTGVELQVRDEFGTPLNSDQCGTVWVRSGMLADGLLGPQDQLIPLVDADGWATVGDVGRLDASGFLTLIDRASNMIISGGLNVYPAQVESTLRQHPDLAEVVVIGVADEYWGERVCAVCQFDAEMPGFVGELRKLCAEQLAKHQRPARYYRVRTWPWTASTKIDRAAVLQGVTADSDWLERLS